MRGQASSPLRYVSLSPSLPLSLSLSLALSLSPPLSFSHSLSLSLPLSICRIYLSRPHGLNAVSQLGIRSAEMLIQLGEPVSRTGQSHEPCNPAPLTPNSPTPTPKPRTSNPKLHIPNPEPQTPHPTPQTPHPTPHTPHSKPPDEGGDHFFFFLINL